MLDIQYEHTCIHRHMYTYTYVHIYAYRYAYIDIQDKHTYK
jgi:hypothetical protein